MSISIHWDDQRVLATYLFKPTSGSLVTGGDTVAPSRTNVRSYRGALAADGVFWSVTNANPGGLDLRIDTDNVTLNGANKLIVTYTGTYVTTATNYQVQIYDWVNATWRNMVDEEGNLANVANTSYVYEIYDGFFQSGGSPVSTPVSNFVSTDGNRRVSVRIYSAVASTTQFNLDRVLVEPAIDPMYQATSFTQLQGGAPTGAYNRTQVTDQSRHIVPGTALAPSEFYYSFNNVNPYPGANTIMVSAEDSGNTTGYNYDVRIYNFTTSSWETLNSVPIAASATDAVRQFAKSNVDLSDYVQGGEARVGYITDVNTTNSIRVDRIYIMIGSVNTDSAQSETSFGTESGGTAANTRDLDTTAATPNTWQTTSELEYPAGGQYYATDYDGDVTAGEAAYSSNLNIPLGVPTGATVTGIHWAARYRSNDTTMTVQLGVKDYSGINAVSITTGSGWRPIGTTNALTTYTYSDSKAAATGAQLLLMTDPQNSLDPFNNLTNLRLRTSASTNTSAGTVRDWDFAMASARFVNNTNHPTFMNTFKPTSGSLVAGADTVTPSRTNVRSYRGALAADGVFWSVTNANPGGLDLRVDTDNVTLNGANKLIVTYTGTYVTTATNYQVQIYDWVNATWRNMVDEEANLANTANTSYVYEIYDGFFQSGGSPVSTPVSNFVSTDGNRRVSVRIYSAVASTTQFNLDRVLVEPAIDPMYQATSFTQLQGGAPTGSYNQTQVSDQSRHIVPGTASAPSEFYYSFRNVNPYPGANTILVSAEDSSSATGYNYDVRIYNFTTSSWETLNSTPIAALGADTTRQFAKSSVDLSDYIQNGEMRVGYLADTNTTSSIRVDRIYIMIGSVNTDSAQSETSFGTESGGTAANTRDLDTTAASPNTWQTTSELEYPAGGQYYATDYDGDTTGAEAAYSSNLNIPLGVPTGATVTGIHWAARYRSNDTAMTVQLGVKDYSGINAVSITAGSGWRPIGTTNALTTYTYSDSKAAATGAQLLLATDPQNSLDPFSDTTNLRLRTSASTNISAGTVRDWDFAMVALRWLSDQHSVGQSSYRFENDDGTDVNSNTHPWSADSPRTNVNLGERMNVRIQVENKGGGTASGKTYRIQYDKNDGNWTDVGSNAEIRPASGISGTSGDALTSAICSSNPLIRKNGVWHEDTATSVSFDLEGNTYTEFGFMIQTAEATANTTYRLRLYNETDGKVLDGYKIYPTFTTVGAVAVKLKYSKGAYAELPNDAADLTYFIDSEGYGDISADDSERDPITSASDPVFLYKQNNQNNTDNIEIVWDGQSSVATTTNPIYMEIYNYSTLAWEQVNMNNTTPADTDFTMTYVQSVNLSQYYDGTNTVAVRVYQADGAEVLQTDLFDITFTSALLTQRSYRFQNDDGGDVDSDTNQALADTPRSDVKKGERFTLRIQLDNTGDGIGSSKIYKLQYDKNDSNWVDVGPTAEIRPSYGLAGANGDPVTSPVCSANPRTWSDGSWAENSGTSAATTLFIGYYTELAFMVQTGSAALNTTYRFRLYNQTDNKVLESYNAYPTMTIVNTSNDIYRYSKDTVSSVPANDSSDLTYFLDDRGYSDVADDDSSRDPIKSSSQYAVFLFKKQNTNDTDNISVTWDGQSSLATTTSPVHVELYNFSASSWTQIGLNNTTPANIDFTMAYVQSLDASDYYDQYNTVAVRVYQESGSQTLKTDSLSIDFTSPALTQRSYRFLNDNGTNVNNNTAQEPADTPRADVKIGERLNLRLQIDNTGSGTGSSNVYKLQYDKNDNNWTDVGTTGEIRTSYGLCGDSNDSITTVMCSPNPRAWADGAWFEDSGQSMPYDLDAGKYTEFGYIIQTAWATVDTTYRFRLYNETDSEPLDGYTVLPTMTVVSSANDVSKYSKRSVSSLPLNADDESVESPTYYLDDRGYDDVNADDLLRDPISSSNYPLFLFKQQNTNNTDNISVTWDGQSSVATTGRTVRLQIYNYSSSSWEDVNSNTTTAANDDFTLSHIQSTNQEQYYDGSDRVAVRVYQDTGSETLKTNKIKITFVGPFSHVNSPANRSYLRGTTYTVSGTAGPGRSGAPVVLVEVSTDGGNNWEPATGTTSWTYEWTLSSDGVYTVMSRATDDQDIVEVPSAGSKVTVDNTPPVAITTSPENNEEVSGPMPIVGTATDANFKEYTIEYSRGLPPVGWVTYGTPHAQPVTANVLETVNTLRLYNEGYSFRLTVKDLAGNSSSTTFAVSVLSQERPDSPHGNYQLDTDVCALCHGTHTAVFEPGMLKGTLDFQATLCYVCHDSSGSIYDVQSEFDGKPSHHPIKDPYYGLDPNHELNCTSCHDPMGSAEINGNPYPRILKAKDSAGNVFYQGNQVCYTCHSAGGYIKDMTYFEVNNAHNNTDTGQIQPFPDPLSGTKIKCSRCHEPHGSQFTDLRIAEDNTLCVSCHSDTAYTLRSDNEVAVAIGYPSGMLEPYYAAARVFAQDSFSSPPLSLKGPKEYRVPADDFIPLARGVAVGDATNDQGQNDVVATIWESSTKNAIVMYQQEDSGNGLEPAVVNTGYGGYGVAVGNVNGDTLNEVVTADMSAPNDLRITTFTGTSVLNSTTLSTGGTGGRKVAIGDVDSDGRNDVVVTGYYSDTISVFKQVSGSLMLSQVLNSGGFYPYGVAIGDVNNDGVNEVVVANHGYDTPTPPAPSTLDNVAIFTQSGGNLSLSGTLDNGPETVAWDVAIGDTVDSGAGNEIMCVGHPSGTTDFGRLTIFSIPGGGSQAYSTGSYDSKGIAVGDVDGDSLDDAVALNGDSLSVFTHGAGSVNGPTLYAMSGVNTIGRSDEPGPIAIGDIGHFHPFGHRKEDVPDCTPCHDPHGTTKAEPIRGADGVHPSYNGFNITYTLVDRSIYDYQVCMKCHSSYKNPMDGIHNTAAEFNPANQSYHPILAVGRRQDIPSGAFVSPWGATSRMDCGDCHAQDAGPDPRLHCSSAYPYDLVKPYLGAQVGNFDLLCYNCHEYTYYYPTTYTAPSSYVWKRPQSKDAHGVHTKRGIHCTTCHEPHGNASNPGAIRPDMEMQPQPITGEFLCTAGCHP